MVRRRLVLAVLPVVAVLAGCYQRVVRDDRFAGETEVYEPDRQLDLLDEADEAMRKSERERQRQRQQEAWRTRSP